MFREGEVNATYGRMAAIIADERADSLPAREAHRLRSVYSAAVFPCCAAITWLLLVTSAASFAASMDDLLRAYPDALAGFDGVDLIWRDGTRMPVDDGLPDKSMEEQLRHGSILDQLRLPYLAGRTLLPAPQQDPGRVRNRAFFDKMYGDCRGGVRRRRGLCPWSGYRTRGDMLFTSRRSTASIGSWQRSRANWTNCPRKTKDIFTRWAAPMIVGTLLTPGKPACTAGARRSISTQPLRTTGCGTELPGTSQYM
jgi:hypothetical protein